MTKQRHGSKCPPPSPKYNKGVFYVNKMPKFAKTFDLVLKRFYSFFAPDLLYGGQKNILFFLPIKYLNKNLNDL